MKQWLMDMMICPECVAQDVALTLEIREAQADDILDGDLCCPRCSRRYPIRDGVAMVLPDASRPILANGSGYNSRSMLSAYLWSHYCDLFQDPCATEAYQVWSSFFRPSPGCALDIGCSVGRLSFELSKTHGRVVGIDTSLAFIAQARELLRNRSLRFDLIVEGFLTEERACAFDAAWNYERIDFIVADALALPFAKHFFSTVTSINILEKVSRPIQHLSDIDRVLKKENGMLVFSDPFSWDETVSEPHQWLSGVDNGHGPLRGIDAIGRYFKGQDGIFRPPLTIAEQGQVAWKIRKTENLWEHITSHFVVGTRT